MALWVCDGCDCAYSVGAAKCPQCGGTRHRGDWEAPADAAAVATEPLATGGVIPANAAPVVEDGPPALTVPPAAKNSEAATASQPTTGKAST